MAHAKCRPLREASDDLRLGCDRSRCETTTSETKQRAIASGSVDGVKEHEHATGKRFLLSPTRAGGRMILVTVLGLAACFVLTPGSQAWWLRAVVGWDVAALALVVVDWATISKATAPETKRRAAEDDPGRVAVFALVLGSSLFSLFASGYVLKRVHDLSSIWSGLALAAIVLSWLVTHTAYTLRYAHLYYRPGTQGGLNFPGDEPPADIDFAYFAFTIGMCFQVSDVTITSRECRQATLLHAVLSFFYNTAILALALNLAIGLMS